MLPVSSSKGSARASGRNKAKAISGSGVKGVERLISGVENILDGVEVIVLADVLVGRDRFGSGIRHTDSHVPDMSTPVAIRDEDGA